MIQDHQLFLQPKDLYDLPLVINGQHAQSRTQSIDQYAFISNMTFARLLQYLEVIKRIHKNLHW